MEVLVDSTGENAQRENPHEMFTGELLNGCPVLNDEWDRFDHANPPLVLTVPQKPNEVIEVARDPIWQYRIKLYTEPESWINTTYLDALKKKERFGGVIRQAYAPIENKGESYQTKGITNRDTPTILLDEMEKGESAISPITKLNEGNDNVLIAELSITDLYVIVDAGANVVGTTIYKNAQEPQKIADRNFLGSHFVIRLDAHLSALHSWFEKGVDDLLRD
jgi:hypothetical protein